jgi:hypothetical protein
MAKCSNKIVPLPDLEPDICDLTLAAEIGFDAAMAEEIGGKTLFAIEQFERRAKSLREKFYGIS